MRSDCSKKLSVLLYSDTNVNEKIQKCVDSILVTSGLSPEKIQILFLKPAGWKNETQKRSGILAVSSDEAGDLSDEEQPEKETAESAAEKDEADREEKDSAEDDSEENDDNREVKKEQSLAFSQGNAMLGLSADELLKKRAEQYPGSLEIIDVDEMEAVEAYNLGLKKASGEYLSFMLASSWYSEDALAIFASNEEGESEHQERLISLKPVYCAEDGSFTPYSVLPYRKGMRDGMIRPEFVQIVLQAFLIKREMLDGLLLREDLHEEAFIELALELQSRNDGKFLYKMEYPYYYTVPLEDDEAGSILPGEKWWYMDSVQNFLIEFMKKKQQQYDGKIPRYIQNAVYYLLCVKYSYNLDKHNKRVLNKEEALAFFDLSCELFTMLDNEVIYQSAKGPKKALPRPLRMTFLKGKAEKMGYRQWFSHASNTLLCNYQDTENQQVIAKTKAGNIAKESVNFRVINYSDGKLQMDGYLQFGGYLDQDVCELYGEISNDPPVQITMDRSPVYDLLKCFDVTYSRRCSVHFEVPVSELLGTGRKLTFYIRFAGKSSPLNLKFSSVNSRLLEETEKAYWRFGHDKYLLYREGRSLAVEKSSAWQVLKREISLDREYLKKDDPEAKEFVRLRLLYWLTRPYYKKKRIWLTYDKLYKGGDNGEYFFRYCQTRNDGIDCYYVINGDALDCPRLEKEYGKKILRNNSLRCRLLALFAEATMSTHANPVSYVGYQNMRAQYIKGLFRADDVCIQHGLTMQRIAQIQNRVISNTKLYCCASPYEVENIRQPIYGYDPDMIKLTGLARYDGLKSRSRKQILITPTWRSYIAMPVVMGSTRPYNPDFKNTDYFKIYERLISDDKLIETARETGYELVYLLHPVVSVQKCDYTVKDGVKLVSALEISYEDMLTESDLMVTDYSGVQYDFAYQRKPVVYYHPDALPPHYGEGGMDYEGMGFGPIHKEHEALVECLCRYMQEGCRMEQKYLERVNQFFAYSDFHNSERIYEEVLKMENRMQAQQQ